MRPRSGTGAGPDAEEPFEDADSADAQRPVRQSAVPQFHASNCQPDTEAHEWARVDHDHQEGRQGRGKTDDGRDPETRRAPHSL